MVGRKPIKKLVNPQIQSLLAHKFVKDISHLHRSDSPDKTMKVYAILDDQSNRLLVSSNVFETLDIGGETTEYKLTSCAGVVETSGRQAHDLVVTSFDETSTLTIPIVIECNRIRNMRDEIPTPDVVIYHNHLNDIAKYLPEIDVNAPISILIGRDIPEAHHVFDQRIGVITKTCFRLGYRM